MNNKQRAKIYRQAAEIIANCEQRFGCDALAVAAEVWFDKDLENVFPEFWYFKFQCEPSIAWWGDVWASTDETRECRIIALLLSEQMALNP